MLEIFQIAKRTISENFNLKSVLIYFGIVVLLAVLFNLEGGYHSTINELEAGLASSYFIWAFLIAAGAPFLIYVSYLSSGSVNKELNSGTALLLFTRPVSRGNFLIGKFLGIIGYIAIINAIIFLFVPAMYNLFFDASTNIMGVIYQISFTFYIFSLLFATTFIALSITLSTVFKHNISVFLIMIVLVLGLFILPPINEELFKIDIMPNVIEPTIAATSDALVSSGNVSGMLYSITSIYGEIFYQISTGIVGAPNMFIKNEDASLTLILTISVIVSLLILAVGIYLFSKKDIF